MTTSQPQADDRRTGVLEVRSGSPTLLFVHGFACAKEDWKGQMAALSGQFRCIALDLPGHGGLPLPAEASVSALAADVTAAKDRFTGQVVLVGHSLGAKVVREAYLQSPQRVAGLVFVDGALYEKAPHAMQLSARERINRIGFAEFARQHFTALFGNAAPDGFQDHVVSRAAALDPGFGRDLYLDAIGYDFARGVSSLGAIDVPVLVLQSSHVNADGCRRPMQPYVETALMRCARRHTRQAEVVRIFNSSHFPMYDQPDVVHARIKAFAISLP